MAFGYIFLTFQENTPSSSSSSSSLCFTDDKLVQKGKRRLQGWNHTLTPQPHMLEHNSFLHGFSWLPEHSFSSDHKSSFSTGSEGNTGTKLRVSYSPPQSPWALLPNPRVSFSQRGLGELERIATGPEENRGRSEICTIELVSLVGQIDLQKGHTGLSGPMSFPGPRRLAQPQLSPAVTLN